MRCCWGMLLRQKGKHETCRRKAFWLAKVMKIMKLNDETVAAFGFGASYQAWLRLRSMEALSKIGRTSA